MAKVKTHRHIGEILYRKGIITKDQLDKAFRIQATGTDMSARKFAEILHEELDVDWHVLMKAISDIFVIKEFKLNGDGLDDGQLREIKELIDSIPEWVLNDYIEQNALPISQQDQKLVILTSDPTNPKLNDLANQLSANHFELVYCKRDSLHCL